MQQPVDIAPPRAAQGAPGRGSPLQDPPLRLIRPAVPVVVQQHVEDTAALRHVRSVLVRAPHVRLLHLQRLDDRLAAHIDGMGVAGPAATQQCLQALDRPATGSMFAAAVQALQARDTAALARLIAVCTALPETVSGLVSAFGWVPAAQLQGLVQPLLEAPDPLHRVLGLTACRLHHVDPGVLLPDALRSKHPWERAEGLRTAAVLGRTDLVEPMVSALADPALAFEAARALCLLGRRSAATVALQEHALAGTADGGTQRIALTLLLQSLDFEHARHLVRSTARTARGNQARERLALRACGLLGDVQLVPWLIESMDDPAHARLAGESFSLLTGADLALLDLDRKDNPRAATGPDDDPAHDAVALDEDDNLPWPDRRAVEQWWQEHAAGMPGEDRCFMGASPGTAHCEAVLRTGGQRQRSVAAYWLCTLEPGRRLFNIFAPTRRQRRLLGLNS
jgi:uncharacterized protein (TIGR02270 family)